MASHTKRTLLTLVIALAIGTAGGMSVVEWQGAVGAVIPDCEGPGCPMPAGENQEGGTTQSSSTGRTGQAYSSSLKPPPLESEDEDDDEEEDEDEEDDEVENSGGGGSGTSGELLDEEAKRRLEEEQERLKKEEELRKARELLEREEEAKRLEEERHRIEEALEEARRVEAERLRQVEEARKKAAEAMRAGETVQGCMTAEGTWTTDRGLCTSQQVVSEGGTDETRAIADAEIERKMDQRFQVDQTLQRRRQELLILISDTAKRLTLIRDGNLVAPDGIEFLNQTIEWLNGGFDYFSAPERTPDEVKLMAEYVQQILDHARALVQATQTERGPAPDIARVYLTTENMLGAIPDVLLILTSEGIQPGDEALKHLDNAVALFPEIRNACSANRDTCGRLREVLENLEKAQIGIMAAIEAAGKPEVEQRLHELMDAKMRAS